MKIEVSTPGLSVPIKLFFPTSLIKSRLIWKMIEKNSGWDEADKIREYQPLIISCYDALSEYVRVNGHFNLVEVSQPDGTRVVIRL